MDSRLVIGYSVTVGPILYALSKSVSYVGLMICKAGFFDCNCLSTWTFWLITLSAGLFGYIIYKGFKNPTDTFRYGIIIIIILKIGRYHQIKYKI